MPIKIIGTTSDKIIEANLKRKLLTITNNHASAIVYLSDEPNPSSSDAKWILYPYETLIFDGQGDFPDRALFGISDTASTNLMVGFQNEED